MKFTITIILFYSFVSSSAQIEKEFASSLVNLDFRKIDSLKNHAKKNDSTLNIIYQDFAEITGNFQGGYLLLSYGSPYEHGILARIKCIRHNDKIVYYDLRDEQNEYFYFKSNLSKYLTPVKLYSFSTKLYNKLFAEFNAQYECNFNLKEFFQRGIVYGDECGVAGEKIPEMKFIDSLVSNRDKASIMNWVHSSNIAKQIYGLNGLYRLNQNGIPISNSEKQLIHQIMMKKGTIMTCSGCEFEDLEINEICKNFNF